MRHAAKLIGLATSAVVAGGVAAFAIPRVARASGRPGCSPNNPLPVPSTSGAARQVPLVAERLRRMWPEVTGESGPMPAGALEIALAQAWLESGVGTWWKDKSADGGGDMRGSNNLGARQCGANDSGGDFYTCVEYGDSAPNADGTQTYFPAKFRYYKAGTIGGKARSAEDAAAYDFLYSIVRQWPALAELKAGDVLGYCMRQGPKYRSGDPPNQKVFGREYKGGNGYYGGFGATMEERVGGYGQAIRSHLPAIAAALGHKTIQACLAPELLGKGKAHAAATNGVDGVSDTRNPHCGCVGCPLLEPHVHAFCPNPAAIKSALGDAGDDLDALSARIDAERAERKALNCGEGDDCPDRLRSRCFYCDSASGYARCHNRACGACGKPWFGPGGSSGVGCAEPPDGFAPADLAVPPDVSAVDEAAILEFGESDDGFEVSDADAETMFGIEGIGVTIGVSVLAAIAAALVGTVAADALKSSKEDKAADVVNKLRAAGIDYIDPGEKPKKGWIKIQSNDKRLLAALEFLGDKRARVVQDLAAKGFGFQMRPQLKLKRLAQHLKGKQRSDGKPSPSSPELTEDREPVRGPVPPPSELYTRLVKEREFTDARKASAATVATPDYATIDDDRGSIAALKALPKELEYERLNPDGSTTPLQGMPETEGFFGGFLTALGVIAAIIAAAGIAVVGAAASKAAEVVRAMKDAGFEPLEPGQSPRPGWSVVGADDPRLVKALEFLGGDAAKEVLTGLAAKGWRYQYNAAALPRAIQGEADVTAESALATDAHATDSAPIEGAGKVALAAGALAAAAAGVAYVRMRPPSVRMTPEAERERVISLLQKYGYRVIPESETIPEGWYPIAGSVQMDPHIATIVAEFSGDEEEGHAALSRLFGSGVSVIRCSEPVTTEGAGAVAAVVAGGLVAGALAAIALAKAGGSAEPEAAPVATPVPAPVATPVKSAPKKPVFATPPNITAAMANLTKVKGELAKLLATVPPDQNAVNVKLVEVKAAEDRLAMLRATTPGANAAKTSAAVDSGNEDDIRASFSGIGEVLSGLYLAGALPRARAIPGSNGERFVWYIEPAPPASPIGAFNIDAEDAKYRFADVVAPGSGLAAQTAVQLAANAPKGKRRKRRKLTEAECAQRVEAARREGQEVDLGEIEYDDEEPESLGAAKKQDDFDRAVATGTDVTDAAGGIIAAISAGKRIAQREATVQDPKCRALVREWVERHPILARFTSPSLTSLAGPDVPTWAAAIGAHVTDDGAAVDAARFVDAYTGELFRQRDANGWEGVPLGDCSVSPAEDASVLGALIPDIGLTMPQEDAIYTASSRGVASIANLFAPGSAGPLTEASDAIAMLATGRTPGKAKPQQQKATKAPNAALAKAKEEASEQKARADRLQAGVKEYVDRHPLITALTSPNLKALHGADEETEST